MDVRVLGALEVLGPGGWESPSAGLRRRVLATLTLTPGEVVPSDRIADALWGDEAPSSANKIIQNHVLAFRRSFDPSLIATHPSGYAFGTPLHTTDVQRFDALARMGREALEGERPREAFDLLDEAIRLWRGDPFPDLESWNPARAETARLDEVRREVVEQRLDALVARGGHTAAIPELEAAIADEPLRERRWELLMVALYRDGRQADALRTYQRARTVLDRRTRHRSRAGTAGRSSRRCSTTTIRSTARSHLPTVCCAPDTHSRSPVAAPPDTTKETKGFGSRCMKPPASPSRPVTTKHW